MIESIFCISTGRCGTDYLKSLLETLNNVNVFHEQKPLLHNKCMRSYLLGDKRLLNKFLPEKIKKIQETHLQNKLYIDTSHIFIKSFGWELPQYFEQDKIGVIILKREKQKVIQSTHRIHSGPYTYLGRKWIITPHNNYVIKPPISNIQYQTNRLIFKLINIIKGEYKSIPKTYPKWIEKSSLKLINWYYDETYALGELFKKTFPKITFVEVTLEELNTREGFENIINQFKLQDRYSFKKVEPIIGLKRNLKLKIKS